MNLFMNTEKQLILVCCIISYSDLSFLKHFHTKYVINEHCCSVRNLVMLLRFCLSLHHYYIFIENEREHANQHLQLLLVQDCYANSLNWFSYCLQQPVLLSLSFCSFQFLLFRAIVLLPCCCQSFNICNKHLQNSFLRCTVTNQRILVYFVYLIQCGDRSQISVSADLLARQFQVCTGIDKSCLIKLFYFPSLQSHVIIRIPPILLNCVLVTWFAMPCM